MQREDANDADGEGTRGRWGHGGRALEGAKIEKVVMVMGSDESVGILILDNDSKEIKKGDDIGDNGVADDDGTSR